MRQAPQGPFFEDFSVGQLLNHGGRTITEADNIWFTLLTCNTNPIHFDRVYASGTEFGRPLVNSTLTMSLATGLSVKDLSAAGINLGWEEIRLPAPLFPEDTLYAVSEILSCRSSRSRPNMGILTVRTIGRQQDGVVVIELKRTMMIPKRPTPPHRSTDGSRAS